MGRTAREGCTETPGDELMLPVDCWDHFPSSSEEPPNPPALPNVHDESGASRSAAAAGMEPPFLIRKSIVKSELLVCGNVTVCDDPNATANGFGDAVRSAGVIDQPSDIFAGPPVEIATLVQIKDIDRAVPAAALPLQPLQLALLGNCLGDTFAGVFDHVCS